ncbi:pantoate--beta-alanine ligase [Pinibacter aurantiacus]|uniref:Pantothenate synthetase n=1 Tax=Pinibacter aurantiacus TaxID=2851599 RepID=A0A9E2SEI4_9BACT|nr:pantoate--beta-alanine ligase [Pinibacter aurantiacus]MBV4358585.1 pantoate--beta-alanine ligase [Pinibacter aurantiacus]
MTIIKGISELQENVNFLKNNGKTIGFVPTMGALHDGHISLIAASKSENNITVCSIFVNPTQFNDPKDFEKYPITIEADIEKLELSGTNILFLPSVKEMYPDGFDKAQPYDLGFIETILEGKYRPGHFQGVCQIVHKLLLAVQPHNLYMGQKDYQQCMVINKLIQIENLDTKLHTRPTLREKDGLAMSSRNVRLNEEERKNALTIYRVLNYLKDHIEKESIAYLLDRSNLMLTDNNFRPDYVSIADAETLAPVENWDGHQKIVALIAAYQNEVRLIDNMVLD